jgi:hypothetical protein
MIYPDPIRTHRSAVIIPTIKILLFCFTKIIILNQPGINNPIRIRWPILSETNVTVYRRKIQSK